MVAVADRVTDDWVVVRIPIAVETATGLRVSAERHSGFIGSDLPLLRLPDGRPYIPGSSVKGVLRATAERLLGGRRVRACDVLDNDVRCGGPGGAGVVVGRDALCWTCRLFGSPHWAGRVWAGDLVPDVVPATVVRDGVGIDRDELRARDNAKFDYEVIPPGVVLRGELRVDDPEPGDLGLLLALWDLVDAGLVTFGGGASRGLGRLRLLDPPQPLRWQASNWSPGSEPAQLDRAGLLEELTRRLDAEGGAGAQP